MLCLRSADGPECGPATADVNRGGSARQFGSPRRDPAVPAEPGLKSMRNKSIAFVASPTGMPARPPPC